jgi:hypothetical protein
MNLGEVILVSALATGLAFALGLALGTIFRAESRRW